MLAIYCRISKRKDEGQDTSILTQKKMGEEFAIKSGLAYQYYIDEGISGQKDEDDRPAFAQMLKDITKGIITSVWAIDQSRLERNPKIWHLFVSIILDNKVNYYPSGKIADLDDPTTQLVAGIVSLTNQMFAKLTGIKVKKSILENIDNGKFHGMPAYGYTKDEKGVLKIHPQQSEVIKRIFQLSLEGIGTYTIANILNDDGVPTKYNNFEGFIKKVDKYTKEITAFDKKTIKWRGNVVYDMLVNPVYKGKLKLNNVLYDVPAILTPEHWQEVNENLSANKKKVGKREEYKYLLNGLVYCENCGRIMRGKKRSVNKDSAYKCGGGMGCRGMSIEKLETFIVKHLFQSKTLKELLNDAPTVSDSRVTTQKTKLQKKQDELKSIKKQLKRLLVVSDEDEDDELIAVEYKKARQRNNKLEKEIKVLELEVSELESNFALNHFNNIVEGFKVNQSFEVVKASIHSLIKKITVAHFKEDKGGYFIMRIEYKRFEDVSLFLTDYALYKWQWTQYYRNQHITDEEKQQDRELYEYLNNSDTPEDFAGYETTSIMHEQVIFTKDDLITFN